MCLLIIIYKRVYIIYKLKVFLFLADIFRAVYKYFLIVIIKLYILSPFLFWGIFLLLTTPSKSPLKQPLHPSFVVRSWFFFPTDAELGKIAFLFELFAKPLFHVSLICSTKSLEPLICKAFSRFPIYSFLVILCKS